MTNDNIANCIAYFLHESQDFSFRQLPPGWPPIPLLARRLSRLKVVVSTFQKSVCRALNASAASIQNMRVDHRRADQLAQENFVPNVPVVPIVQAV
jgi:hypothetical protein